MTTSNQIRPLTRDLYEALMMDVWPSPAACIDFGIESEAHLGALQYAVTNDEVSLEQLDAALGKGAALQALVSPTNPYRFVTFRTAWDELSEGAAEHEGEPLDQEGWPWGLDDDRPWRETYPDLPPVEEAEQLADPVFWMKTHEVSGDATFFVAGHTPGAGFEKRRFYGLVLFHNSHQMEWVQFDEYDLDFEGPGQWILVVDDAWTPRRFSRAVEEYPGYTFKPDSDLWRHPRYPLIAATDVRTLKESFAKARDIDSMALIGDEFDLDKAERELTPIRVGIADCDWERREGGARDLAARGLLFVAVKDPEEVPETWRPYVLALDEFPDDQPCTVTFAAGMYYVRLIGRSVPFVPRCPARS